MVRAGVDTVEFGLHMMERLTSPSGPIVSYDKSGAGPTLVLVHGGFSDHDTNWEFVKPILSERFTIFFRDMLHVPVHELDALRATPLWPPIVADAKASLGDLRALARYRFGADRCRALDLPVLLQIGSESPRDLYVTDALAAVLPDARIETLPGQAHEGMTTAPEMYAEAVTTFLLDEPALAG